MPILRLTCRSVVDGVKLATEELPLEKATVILGGPGSLKGSLAAAAARASSREVVPRPRYRRGPVECRGVEEFDLAVWVGSERAAAVTFAAALEAYRVLKAFAEYAAEGRAAEPTRSILAMFAAARSLECAGYPPERLAECTADRLEEAVEKLDEMLLEATYGVLRYSVELTKPLLAVGPGISTLASAVQLIEDLISGIPAVDQVRELPYRVRVHGDGTVDIYDARTQKVLPPGSVGAGAASAQVLLAAAVAVAVARSEGRKVLLVVEDPEVGLSVKGQEAIGYLLGALPHEEPQVATLLTTTSSHVADGLKRGAGEHGVDYAAYQVEYDITSEGIVARLKEY